jgi:hypothetical protein
MRKQVGRDVAGNNGRLQRNQTPRAKAKSSSKKVRVAWKLGRKG